MLLKMPTPNAEQITKWLEQSMANLSPSSETSARGRILDARRPAAIDFKKVRDAVRRARNKTDIKTVKPFRRLRTNQAAVNESLIDAIGALLAKNKEMAAELEAMGTELAQLRSQLANGAARESH